MALPRVFSHLRTFISSGLRVPYVLTVNTVKNSNDNNKNNKKALKQYFTDIKKIKIYLAVLGGKTPLLFFQKRIKFLLL